MRSKKLVSGALGALALLVALFFLLDGVSAAAQNEPAGEGGQRQRASVQQAVKWLVLTHQNEDGGYTAFSSGAGEAPSDVAGTVDALLALGSSGYNVSRPYPGQASTAVDYLEQNPEAVGQYAAGGGGANGKLILALVAANQDPRDFAGHNFVISLTNHLSPTGQYNTVSPFEQSLALLAHAVVSDSVPSSATQWLIDRQSSEPGVAGSWDDGFGTAGNVDATAMAVMALVAAGEGVTGTVVSDAVAFLSASQLESGGWGYTAEAPESANSSALAVQALSAVGEAFYSSEGQWARDGVSPLEALLSWQSESGAFQADFGEGRFDDFFTTIQALPAATGRAYPLPGRLESAREAIACLAELQDAETGGWPEFAGNEADAGGTARALQALAAYGEEVTAERWRSSGNDPLAALAALTPTYLQGGRGGRVGVVMQGVVAGGGDVTDFGGHNLVISMTEYLSPTGEYDSSAFGPFSHAEAMLGLVRAGESVDAAAVEWLLAAQDDGSWGGADATGISLQVLAEVEALSPELRSAALEQLRETQMADGGWGFEFPSSVNSTAEVAQGLVAVGENPFDPTWSQVMSGTLRNAGDVALSQQGQNGCWPNQFGPGDDPFATTDGVLLLALDPVWGNVGQAEVAAQETPTAEATAPEATGTAEATVTVEPTVAPPTATVEEPTAEPATAAPSPTVESEVAETPAPVATTVNADDGGEAETGFPWLVVAAIGLILVVGVVWLAARRA